MRAKRPSWHFTIYSLHRVKTVTEPLILQIFCLDHDFLHRMSNASVSVLMEVDSLELLIFDGFADSIKCCRVHETHKIFSETERPEEKR